MHFSKKNGDLVFNKKELKFIRKKAKLYNMSIDEYIGIALAKISAIEINKQLKEENNVTHNTL
jgi:hypothetical protein